MSGRGRGTERRVHFEGEPSDSPERSGSPEPKKRRTAAQILYGGIQGDNESRGETSSQPTRVDVATRRKDLLGRLMGARIGSDERDQILREIKDFDSNLHIKVNLLDEIKYGTRGSDKHQEAWNELEAIDPDLCYELKVRESSFRPIDMQPFY